MEQKLLQVLDFCNWIVQPKLWDRHFYSYSEKKHIQRELQTPPEFILDFSHTCYLKYFLISSEILIWVLVLSSLALIRNSSFPSFLP